MIEVALDRLIDRVTSIARISAWVTGAMLAISALIIVYDIAVRYLFNFTVGGGTELAGYALAIASTWGLTVTLLRRGHVRIDAVYTHLPQRARSLLDMVGLLAFIAFMAIVARYGYAVVEQSIISGTHSVTTLEVPLFLPQAFWFAGLAFFLFSATLLLARSFVAFVRGDVSKVHSLIGARSVVEEIEVKQKSQTAGRSPAGNGPPGGT